VEEVYKEMTGLCYGFKISNFGNVKNKKDKITKKHDTKGYCVSAIKGRAYLIHRLVGQYFIDNPDNKPQINHKDGNKKNNIVTNLEWVTCKENMRHRIDSGIYNNAGENHPFAKLSEKDVKHIRFLFKLGFTGKEINLWYSKVSEVTLHKIKHRQAWVNFE
jgi:hypothetical protein